ncbi:hypothetical protein [Streptomyces clavifer]
MRKLGTRLDAAATSLYRTWPPRTS